MGALAAYLISRRVQRQTHDLAFSDIAALLAEREAMLHGIREGVVALDRAGRVRLINDEAQRLLGIGEEAVGRSLDEALGAGRTTDVLAGRVTGTGPADRARAACAGRQPHADRRRRAPSPPCATGPNWSSSAASSTPPTVCSTPCAPRTTSTPTACTPFSGCSNWRCSRTRWSSSSEVVGGHRATAEQVTEKIHDPLLAALLVGKATVAAERGVSLRVSARTLLPDRLVDPRGLVTVVGNLVDNALDAAPAPRTRAWRSSCARRAVQRSCECATGDRESRRNSAS